MNELSILISTYKNTKYLKECFDSIIKSIGDKKVEVIVGIDACIETYNYVKSNEFPSNFKFLFFQKNNGPYIVFNSLSTIAKSKNLLFFGSDDVMCDDMVEKVIKSLKRNDVARPHYIDFQDGEEIDLESKREYSIGVFGIKKSLFLDLNGFEPWVCAADTEFQFREDPNNLKVKILNDVLFYRRIHPNGLTSNKNTGFSSQVREHYYKLIKNKKNKGPLEILTISEYKEMNDVNISKVEEINELFIEKEKTRTLINSILNKKYVV